VLRGVGVTRTAKRTQDQIRLPTSLQSLPQFIEVPPNIEIKPIVPGSFPLLSYSSNPLLSKHDSKLLIFSAVGKSFADTIFGRRAGNRRRLQEGGEYHEQRANHFDRRVVRSFRRGRLLLE